MTIVLCFYCEPHLLQDQVFILLAIACYATSEKHLILSHLRLSLRSLMHEMGSTDNHKAQTLSTSSDFNLSRSDDIAVSMKQDPICPWSPAICTDLQTMRTRS